MAASSSSQSEFDPNKASKGMDKYSRQVGAYGVGVMRFLRELRVLVVGAKGIGIEAAKNLVLTGCKAVHLHDDGLAEVADLGTNFFLRAEHVGKPRAASLASFVQELNEDVEVEAVSGDVAGLIGSYGAVIVTDNTIPLATLTAWNELARSHNIVFTVAITSGVLGFLFADFGDKHICSDFDGEPHKYIAIQNITRNEHGKYELQLDDPHELDDHSHIQIEDVEGIPEFKDKIFVIRRFYTAAGKLVPDRLIVDSVKGAADTDFSSWGTYEKGGYLREVKAEIEINHKPLQAALHDAQVLYPDQEKYFLGAPARLILAQSALWAFIAAHGHLPRLHSTEDAAALQLLAKEAHASFTAANAANVADLEPEEINKVSLYARTEISGLCAFLGGVVAQEVIKKSSKWNPITQFLVHELFDLVDETVPAEATPVGSRYDNHLALFGKAFQDSLMNDKWFLVGCGALGCEYMKAFALMGVSCGPEGLLNATDMDTIEVSNLARQFLFRREHVGKQKSACATAAAKVMNPDMKIRVYTDMVAPKTEHVFNEVFWESLTGVVNALDNIQARLYVDSRCVLFKRPLLESGTLGTKANTEVIIPHQTASYGENHVEVKQKHVPQCTFKNFPYLIEHTIGWAGKAGEFATLFVEPANDLKTAIEDLDQFWKNIGRLNQVGKKVERLKPLITLLPKITAPTFETCVDLAFQRLLSQYRDRILTLTHHCPKDMMKTDRDSGKSVPFWSAPKRFPHPIQWDPTNPDHPLVEYIYNTANLYAHMFHLEPKRDLTEGRPEFKAYLVGLNLVAPEWSPGDKSGLGEVEEAEGGSESSGPKEDEVERDNTLLAQFTEAINNFNWAPLREKHSELKTHGDALIRPAEFEKDDDTNFHIDFVTSASNLRAANYGIPTADRHKTKMTAGNIIPAIATTTAMITGLNSIEFLKLKKGLPKHKIHNSNVNLGVSTFSLFEPEAPKKAVAEYDPVEMEEIAPVPPGFTIWDTVVINEGDITLERLLQRFPEIHYGVTIDGIVGPSEEKTDEGTRTKLIYSNFGLFAARVAGYMQKTITEIWQEEYGPLPASSFLPLNVSANLNGTPVKIPNPVIYRYK